MGVLERGTGTSMIFNTIPANKQMFFYRDEITSPAYRVKLAVENGKKDIKIFNAELHRKEFKMEIGMMADDHLFIKIYKKNGSWIVGYSAAGVVRTRTFDLRYVCTYG